MSPRRASVLSAVLLSACSHGGGGGAPPGGQSTGSPTTVITAPTTAYEFTTVLPTVTLTGTLGTNDTPVGWNSATDYHVYADVTWQNIDTAQGGVCWVSAHIVCLPLFGCGLESITWGAEVPLQLGSNHIVITTTDELDYSTGTDEILVYRTAAAWLPACMLWLDAHGELQCRSVRVMR